MERSGIIQLIMAAYPMLMAYPEARLLRFTTGGLDPVNVEETDHFRLMREFWSWPKEFVVALGESCAL